MFDSPETMDEFDLFEDFDKNKTPYRWLLFVFFLLSLLLSSSSSLVFSAISPMLADAFGVSVLDVNMCANIWNATFIPVPFLAMWSYKHYSS